MIQLKKFFEINPWLAALIGFFLLLFSVSSESLDMDEAQTWDYAQLETFSEFWDELKNDEASEAQMPLGMFAWWLWGRLLGTSELAMRSLNLVWAAVALAAMALAGKKLSMGWLPLLFAVQPYLWYAMNHARTPVMQMAAGCLLVCGMVMFLSEKQASDRTLLFLLFGAILLCGANMLGLIPVVSVATGLVAHKIWVRVNITRQAKIVALAGVGVLALLGIYYATTLLRGAGGAKIWHVSPANAAYVLYEFFGFQGLGPGRQDLRDVMRGYSPPSALLPYAPLIFVLLTGYAATLFAAYKAWLTRPFERFPGSPSYLMVWAAGCGILGQSLILLFLLGAIVGFPFWGRHLAGAFPFWVIILAVTMRWAGQGLWRKIGRVATLVIWTLLVLSSALILLAPWHDHDNYRSAAAIAKTHVGEGCSLWWVADHSGGRYYGLELQTDHTPAPGKINFAPNVGTRPNPLPDVIIISRPDNFDRHNTARDRIKSGEYRHAGSLQAFEIWER